MDMGHHQETKCGYFCHHCVCTIHAGNVFTGEIHVVTHMVAGCTPRSYL
jgi:hypothetical protein